MPEIVTLAGKPIVIVPLDSPTSTSSVVPAKVTVPPLDIAGELPEATVNIAPVTAVPGILEKVLQVY